MTARQQGGVAPAPFAARLLPWFDRVRRDLPWRRTRDPWAIWVSEVMLQQTRVEAVREPFERFLRRFPTPASFAAADDDAVLVAWRGLGYYRRARLLRDGARAVVAQHGGAVPDDPDALGELPGIGAYTRGAIASIAFGRAERAIDGNVERVATRHRGIAFVLGTGSAREAIAATVEGWLDRDRPGDFNQALMELGATVCTPSSPDCEHCPVAGDCFARTNAAVDRLPMRKPKRQPLAIAARVVLVVDGGRALGCCVPRGEPNEGQIDLPGPGVLVDVAVDDLAPALRQRFGAVVEVGPQLAAVRHAITHHRITVHAHAAAVRQPGQLTCFDLSPATPWSTPARKVFAAALGHALDA